MEALGILLFIHLFILESSNDSVLATASFLLRDRHLGFGGFLHSVMEQT